MNSLVKNIHDTVKVSWEQIGKPKHILVAFSGGADSTALLTSLCSLKEEQVEITAFHVHHGLRENADLDLNAARQYAIDLNIPFQCAYLNLMDSSEETARDARYGALTQYAREHQIQAIALGHHMQDQCETFIMRLCRGSLDGLACMREKQTVLNEKIFLWRPFLKIKPEDLRMYLLLQNINWREDESNDTDVYLRNSIRHHIIPELKTINAYAIEHIATAAGQMNDMTGCLDKEAENWLKNHSSALFPCPFIDNKDGAYDLLDSVMKNRIIRLFFRNISRSMAPIPYSLSQRFFSLKKCEKINLPHGWTLRKSDRFIHFIPPVPPKANIAAASLEPIRNIHVVGDGIHLQSLPETLFAECTLRFWQPGDYIRPFGMKGTKTLQDYFVDKKIDREFRHYIPLLCLENEIIWAVGVGASEKTRFSEKKNMLLLHYPIRLPFEMGYNNSILGNEGEPSA